MTAWSLETARTSVAAAVRPPVPSQLLEIEPRQGPYRVRLASSLGDRLSAFRLRFEVFNLELNEGLEAAYQIGHDVDEFDTVCDHLIVEHANTSRVVGTYRLQTGEAAQRHYGYYSEREFDFAPYETLRPALIELGRACIHRAHRSTEVLYLLWRGVAQYALLNGARFLIGCSSLSSQDPVHGNAVFGELSNYLVEPALRTQPQVGFVMRRNCSEHADARVPKLLRTYLAIGARICGPPALDCKFKTIDFLTLLDLQALHPRMRARFLR